MEKQFRIFEITKDLVDDILSRSYEAHFHDFEEIIILSEGGLEHYVDFKIEKVDAPVACYVPMNKMHKLVPCANMRGWVVNYKTEFVPESKLNFISNFNTSTNIPLLSDENLNRFTGLCHIMHREYKQEYIDLKAISHLLNGFITMIDTQRKRIIPVENTIKASQISAFNNFLKILEENFRRDAGVTFYAEKMNMSERNLNIICRNNFQKSVSEIIETRKLIEAKHLLLHTDKSVSEIGYELGYNEKSYFTRVFHAKMDITPTRFREMTRSILS